MVAFCLLLLFGDMIHPLAVSNVISQVSMKLLLLFSIFNGKTRKADLIIGCFFVSC